MKNRPPIVYEFGHFRLDTADCRLLRRGQPIALRPKLYELLKVLVEHRWQVVGKDELINAIGPDLNVDDGNLTVSVNALPRALGGNEYIETVTKRGYRRAMEVRVMSDQVTPGERAAPQLPAPDEPEPPGGAMHLVWGLDEVDRLFNYDYASEIFGLLRSWHNLRALEPAGPWRRLTLALAYATESHLFITDLNQSPFNVGLQLTLEDFTIAHVVELNRRYAEPLR